MYFAFHTGWEPESFKARAAHFPIKRDETTGGSIASNLYDVPSATADFRFYLNMPFFILIY